MVLKLSTAKIGVTEIPKKPCARTLVNSQHVKVSERLLKPAPQHFCHILWLLWNEISSKNFVLVGTEILRLFLNILTPNDKYFLSKSECLTQPIQMQLSQKEKNIFSIFFCISENCIKFGILWNRRWSSEVISFSNYKLQKAGLLKCLKASCHKTYGQSLCYRVRNTA